MEQAIEQAQVNGYQPNPDNPVEQYLTASVEAMVSHKSVHFQGDPVPEHQDIAHLPTQQETNRQRSIITRFKEALTSFREDFTESNALAHPSPTMNSIAADAAHARRQREQSPPTVDPNTRQ